jgi:hypothetical protein
MNDTTQFINNTRAIGQCRFDWSEKAWKFNRMECLSCRCIHLGRGSTELFPLAGEAKNQFPVLIEHLWRIAACLNRPKAIFSRFVGFGISTGIVAAINRVSPTPGTAEENPPTTRQVAGAQVFGLAKHLS